ncbi:MAG TPA: hypothetical protein VLT33_21405 [Labilithrix sp.]|nr:hypothetical protein [Labilithrix sp.]
MAHSKPDRRALEAQLRAAFTSRGESAPGLAEVELVHRLGEAYGCYAPRQLDRASTLYEEGMRILWDAEGEASPRAIPLLASWLDCARVRRQRLSGPERVMLDKSIHAMRRRAEALLSDAEPRIRAGEPGSRALFADAHTLLQRMGEEQRALSLLHATSPNWKPLRGGD